MNRIGEEEGFDLILTAPSAMYVAERVDLTDRVLSALKGRGGD